MTKINYIAHRGLWNEDLPENSLSAIKNAVDKNFSIEIDVQLTKDKKLVVVHDKNLNRLCGVDKKVNKLALDEIKKLYIKNTKEKIPTLEEVLEVVDGKVMLDIEIKHYNHYFKTTKKAYQILKNYNGKYTIKSFNPIIPKYYKKLDSSIDCGVLIGSYPKKYPKIVKNYLKNLKFIKIFKPDFICYNIKDLTKPVLEKINKEKISLHTYLIKDEELLNKATNICSTIIFEKICIDKNNKNI